MEQEKIESYLHELRNDIKVNEKFKSKLRSSFIKKQRNRGGSWLPLVAAAILFLAVFLPNLPTKQVRADSLLVANGISFVDMGSGEVLAYTHAGGHLYISLKEKGIYIYENKGLRKISEQTADSMSRTALEDQLLFTQNGDVYLLYLNSLETEQVLTGQYKDPEWKDKDHFYVTSDADGKQTIVDIELSTEQGKEIAAGEQVSFVNKEQKLVFQRNGEILLYDLIKKKEWIVDNGKDPSISSNGSYISYVKEQAGVEDVWIADLNRESKKKVTTNPPPRYESAAKAIYRYETPIWGGEERQLYVRKTRIDGENQPTQIMKIRLSAEEMTVRDTVNCFLQALIIRDDDYAMSLMKNPPEFLTYSNPHQIGFRTMEIEESKQSATAKAEVYWTDTALPYYQIGTYEFSMVKEKGRFVIKQVQELPHIELSSNDQEQIQLVKNGQKENLFTRHDIPLSFIADENVRFSSLVLTHDEKTVLFSLQGEDQVAILEYDRESQGFRLLAAIPDAMVTQISIDSTGRFVAVDYEGSAGLSISLFDLTKGKQIEQFTGAHSILWRGKQLLLQEVADSHTLVYELNPQTGHKKIY